MRPLRSRWYTGRPSSHHGCRHRCHSTTVSTPTQSSSTPVAIACTTELMVPASPAGTEGRFGCR